MSNGSITRFDVRWLIILSTLSLTMLFNNCKPIASTDGLISENLDSPDDIPQPTEAQLFFNNQVINNLQMNCVSCHAEPRLVQPPNVAAPLSIFQYSQLRGLLAKGSSSTANDLINKMQNVIAHTGGNRCAAGLAEDPCKTVIDWWNLEFPSAAAGVAGKVISISEVGRVTGWASNPQTPNQKITVYFYGDASASDSGTLLGEAVADKTGEGVNDGHYFTFDLPAEFRNNVTHQLYVYAGGQTDDHLLPDSPVSYAAYSETDEGLMFYTDTVQPQLQACASCHTVDYSTHWPQLLSPTPFAGATALTNDLIVRASGGSDHPGGNFCPGGRNAGLCQTLQQWWNIEFGP